jgi:hypothetical protein
MICPYKNAIDWGSCGSDDDAVRREQNMKLNNISIPIPNYTDIGDKIQLRILDQNVYLIPRQDQLSDDLRYYMDYLTPITENPISDDTKLKSILFETHPGHIEYVTLENSVGTIVKKMKCSAQKFIQNKIIVQDFKRYIYAGLHLKRLGDYAQVDIFNKSDLIYFQTNDHFCFLYASIVLKFNKILILGKKTVLTKIKNSGDNCDYFISINSINMNYAKPILTQITEILQHIQQTGSAVMTTSSEPKIEPRTYNKPLYEPQIFGKLPETPITKDQLIKLINNIPYQSMSYLLYKIDREQYKILLGDSFDEIDNIIEHLKIFEEINYMKHDDVIKLFETLLYFKQNNELINFIRKILDNRDDRNFKMYSYMYYDVLNNFDKYKINIDDDMMRLHKYVSNQYNIIREQPINKNKTGGHYRLVKRK